jgi:hypothetical protein
MSSTGYFAKSANKKGEEGLADRAAKTERKIEKGKLGMVAAEICRAEK